jgi:hypothetical protein
MGYGFEVGREFRGVCESIVNSHLEPNLEVGLMPHGSHVSPKTTSSSRNRWLISVCALFVVLAMGVGSSAAIAKSNHQTSHRPGAGSAASVTGALHDWFSCFRTSMTRHQSTHVAFTHRYLSGIKSCAHWSRPTTTTVPSDSKPTTPTPPTTSVPTEPSTPAPTTPDPTTPAPSGEIATAATTGVPSGTNLVAAKGDLNITKDGTVVDGKDVSGNIWIDADDVTIRSSRISGSGFSVIQIKNGSKGVTIENVEIDGRGAQAGSMGVMGPATVTGSDITGVENGLTPGSGSVLKGNYVHGLKSPGSPHYDGIQIDGGLSDISISGNYVDLHEHSQTSAVMIDNYFGPISGIRVDGNHLVGGGYTVYSDGQFDGGSITGVSFTNNKLGRGQYGYASVVKNKPVWTNNTDATTARLATY